MPVITQKVINRSDLRINPNVMYLFGDNVQRVGKGGQAKAMRGEANAIGIATKKTPTQREDAYFSDDDFDYNVKIIVEDFVPAFKHIAMGGIVIVPEDGLGTGLSDMENRCPKTLEAVNYLIEFLDERLLFKIPTSMIDADFIMEEMLLL